MKKLIFSRTKLITPDCNAFKSALTATVWNRFESFISMSLTRSEYFESKNKNIIKKTALSK